MVIWFYSRCPLSLNPLFLGYVCVYESEREKEWFSFCVSLFTSIGRTIGLLWRGPQLHRLICSQHSSSVAFFLHLLSFESLSLYHYVYRLISVLNIVLNLMIVFWHANDRIFYRFRTLCMCGVWTLRKKKRHQPDEPKYTESKQPIQLDS